MKFYSNFRHIVAILVYFLVLVLSEEDFFKFSSSLYDVHIEEDSSRIHNIVAVQVGSKSPGVTYSLSSVIDSRSQHLFSINPLNGSISATSALDHEFMPVHYLRVDASLDGKHTHTTVRINVDDRNDNGPVFEHPVYNISVHESTPIGSPVLSVRAIDLDSGNNGRISYTISAVSHQDVDFSIDSETGVMTLQKKLDRETQTHHMIIVQAKDNSPVSDQLVSNATVSISVIDDNDNYPLFDKEKYVFQVPEDSSWSDDHQIGQISATDIDSEDNAKITYAIIGGNVERKFSIAKDSGRVFLVGALDRERTPTFTLIVRASDSGNPTKSNTTEVFVIVTDVNDNVPTFPNEKYYQTVSENVPKGYSILQIKAFDLDEGENAEISYTTDSAGSSSPFAINERTGWVYTNTPLDREVAKSYSFFVLAKDGGVPGKQNSVELQIDILDTNDNDPYFPEKDYFVSVSELAPLGSTIIKIQAQDNDEGSRKLRYQIVSGNSRNRFTLASTNEGGVVTVAQPLNYQNEENFLLTINAIDEGGRFGLCRVSIKVIDENDHAPRFQNTPYFADIFEDVSVGHTVLMLTAADDDSDENGRVSYELVTDTDKFKVDRLSGALTIRSPIDRESISTYLLTVKALDNGSPPLEDTTDIEISVLDINDNAPVFTKSQYSGTLREDAMIGTKVLRVHAFDVDNRDNGKVYYEMDDQVTAFEVDRLSGDIRSKASLDRESNSHYDFKIYARDGGTPSNIGWARIQIDIVDVNDNPPSFADSPLTFKLKENAPYGTRVGKIQAYDPDTKENAVISFHLLNSTDSKYFYLGDYDSTGGIYLFSKREFDYEKDGRVYEIVVRAESAPLQTDGTIIIHIEDVNDNEPELKDFRIIYNVQDGDSPIGNIGTIPAFDADPTGHLVFNFTYGNNADLLRLNSSSGSLEIAPFVRSNVNIRAKFGVMVSDGQNDARAHMHLQLHYITSVMLKSSVTIRVANVTELEFLDPFLDFFEEALAVVVPCSKDDISIIGVKSNFLSNQHSCNVTFVVRSPGGEKFYPPAQIKQKIYINKDIFQNILALPILPFSDDICVKEPCLNYERCSTIPKLGNVQRLLVHKSVTLRSLETLLTYSCNCPKGYTGLTTRYTCDVAINLCYSNPCQNGGTCHGSEDSFQCECHPGFTGQLCELTGCTNCSFGKVDDGASRSFSGGAFVALPNLKQRVKLNLTLSFSTVASNGLLFYNGRLNDEDDFVALELLDKSLLFHYSTGHTANEARLERKQGFSDGKFHKVHIDFDERNVFLSHGDCDVKLALVQDASLPEEYRCANTSSPSAEKECGSFLNHCPKYLDLTGPLTFGALPRSVSKRKLFSAQEFNGCIRDVFVDNVKVNFSSDTLINNGSVVGCPERRNFCASNPCLQNASCNNSWNSYRCKCLVGWSGKDCGKSVADSRHLTSASILTFKKDVKPVTYPWSQAIAFKSSSMMGAVLNVTFGRGKYSTLFISDGHLAYENQLDRIVLNSTFVSDGHWQHALVKVMQREVWISLNYEEFETSISMETRFSGEVVTGIAAGGAYQNNFFSGCVQDIEVGNEYDLALEPFQEENVGRCQESRGNETQVQVKPTLDFCSYDLCEHQSICKPHKNDYSCFCKSNETSGRYCENVIEKTCPRHWWGKPTCGPCQCDTSKGFNETCNQLTGACVCKEYHFKDQDACLPCKCYHLGSTSKSCDSKSGQCSCKVGVIGKRCDRCANGQAELTDQGCQVLYGECPAEYYQSIWWDRVAFDGQGVAKCPELSIGHVTRVCTVSGWAKPVFSDCMHKLFGSVDAEGRGESWENASNMKRTLELHKKNNKLTYSRDIQRVYDFTKQVLQREVQMSGFELAHRKDRMFLDNICHLLSWIVDQTQSDKYETLNMVQKYGLKVLKSMSETFTEPFEVTTKNIIFGLDDLKSYRSKRDLSNTLSLALPKQRSNLDGKNPTVLFHIEIGQENRAAIQYTLIRNLNQTLTAAQVDVPKLRSGSRASLFDQAIIVNELTGMSHSVQFEIPELSLRQVPHCVFWDNNFNIWSSLLCEMKLVNSTPVCQCEHGSIQGVIVETVQRGKVFFNDSSEAAMSIATSALAMILLLITFAYLICFNSCERNSISISANVSLTTLIHIAAISLLILTNGYVADSVVSCTGVALILQLSSLASITWSTLSTLHIHRMITELRNINNGEMTFYYFFGYGLPTVLTLLSAGVAGKNYNSTDFCNVETNSVMVWGLLVPEVLLSSLVAVIIFLNIQTVFSFKSDIEDLRTLRKAFFMSVIIQPLLCNLHVSAALLSFYGQESFFVLLYWHLSSLAVAFYIFIAYVIFDVLTQRRQGQQATVRSSASAKPQMVFEHHMECTASLSSTASRSTLKQGWKNMEASSEHHFPYYLDDIDHRSFDLASSHSSDDDGDDTCKSSNFNLSVHDYPKS